MNKLTTAIIGTGNIAISHLQALNAEGRFSLVAACDISKKTIDDFSSQHGIPGYTDYKQMLLEVRPEIAVICVPPGLHYQVAIDALDNDCHLVLEKPACVELSECRKLAEKAFINDRKIILADLSYYTPAVLSAVKYLQHNSLGAFVSGTLTNYKSSYYAQRPQWAFEQHLAGGGQLMNVGVHRVAIIRAVLNKDESSISASVGCYDHRTHLEGNGTIFIRFADGSAFCIEEMGYYEANSQQHNICHFNFEYGTINLGLRDKKTEVIFSDGSSKELVLPDTLPGYFNCYRELADALVENRDPYPSLTEGAKDLRIILATYESSRSRQQIELAEKLWDIDYSNFDNSKLYEHHQAMPD